MIIRMKKRKMIKEKNRTGFRVIYILVIRLFNHIV